MMSIARAAAIAFVAVAAVPLACATPHPNITLDGDRFRVTGPPGTLSVTVAGSDVPLFGETAVDKDGVVFVPRFPLRPGVEYRVVYQRTPADRAERSFTLPPPPAPPPT